MYIIVSLSIVFALWLPLWAGLTQHKKMKTYGQTRDEAEAYLVRLELSHKLMPRFIAFCCAGIFGVVFIPLILPTIRGTRDAGTSPFFWGFVLLGYASVAVLVYGLWLVSKLRVQWLKQRIAQFDAQEAT